MNNPVYRQPRTVRFRQIWNIIQLHYAHTLYTATQNAPSDHRYRTIEVGVSCRCIFPPRLSISSGTYV